MEFIRKFVTSVSVGYWLSLGAAVLSLVTGIVYAAAYNGSNYMSWAAFAMFVVAFVAFAVLASLDATYRIAPAVGGTIDLIAMCLYISAVYMYLSEVFYGGITAAAMAELDPAFVFCLLASVLCVALFVAGIFVRQRRRVKSVAAAEDGGESAETPTAEEAAELSDYDRAYAALSDDVRAFADKVIAHALSLDGAAEKSNRHSEHSEGGSGPGGYPYPGYYPCGKSLRAGGGTSLGGRQDLRRPSVPADPAQAEPLRTCKTPERAGRSGD